LIGQLGKVKAKQTINAKGLVVCPGFVDLHSHADRGILKFRDAENYIRQGATTLVCGNCGSSPVDIAAYFKKLCDGGTGPNIAQLIGHSSVRSAGIGSENVPPTKEQLTEMREVVRRAMQAGSVGLSSGLRYGPGAYADTAEVVALAEEVGKQGGFYATHMRDEGTKIIEAIQEALLVGKSAGVPVHISHHKISSVSVFGLTRQTLAMIDQARKNGRDVTLDQYPYRAGSGSTGLYVPQTSLSGGREAFRKRIANKVQRQQIIEAVEELLVRKIYEADHDPQNRLHTRAALARIGIARAAHDTSLEGKQLVQILESRKKPVTLRNGAELLLELVSHGVGGINYTIDDRPGGDMERVMQHPQTCIASDGSVFRFGEGSPHPRSYGCFPRVLAHFVREKKLLTLETAIHKMTALPVKRLGWKDRGQIKVGHAADVVVFNPKTITDRATFLKPHQHSVGVKHVLVRGEFVLKDEKMTGKRPGRPIMGRGKRD
jgi:dihydroorotase/N-acyl-D-amino-acid deacylase